MLVCPPAIGHNTPRSVPGLGSETSRAGYPASSEAFLNRLRYPLGNFPFNLTQQLCAPAAGGKVVSDLRIPGPFFQLIKPISQPSPIRFGELFNGRLDRLHAHISKLDGFRTSGKSKAEPGQVACARARPRQHRPGFHRQPVLVAHALMRAVSRLFSTHLPGGVPSIGELLQDVLGDDLVHFLVPGHRLGHSSLGVAIPIVPATMADEQAS